MAGRTAAMWATLEEGSGSWGAAIAGKRARLVAEGVLLRRLHHARALPPQLRHHGPQLGRAHGRAVVAAAQPRQRNVPAAERARAPDACAAQGVSVGTLSAWGCITC